MTKTDAAATFLDSPSLKGREDRYVIVTVAPGAVLESWRSSLFSFEWLDPTGLLRKLDDLPIHERDKRLKVERLLDERLPLERPVLGIGLLDNVEIGAGRDVFLTLASRGARAIEVHIPRTAERDFTAYLSRGA